MNPRTADVVVVGAGMIGTAVAWRLAQRGASVIVVDGAAPNSPSYPRPGAWHTAAGMLAPATEGEYSETPLLRLNLDSAARYPDFVAELTELTGRRIGYRDHGTVVAAWDGADLAGLRDLAAFLDRLGNRAQLLTGPELRELEPGLAPGLPGGLFAPDDHSVDPRLLHAALVAAGSLAGVRTVHSVAELLDGARPADPATIPATSAVGGVRLTDGTTVSAATVVLAAGCWSGSVDPDLPIRPVKGQTLRLRGADVPAAVVRGRVRGSSVYVVPRADGEVVIGASVEESGFDLTPRAGAVYELLRDAQSLLPQLGEAEFDEVCTGLRPGTPDNLPLVGRARRDGLVVATGHYRNGVLLAPLTAEVVAALVLDGIDPGQDLDPTRFAPATAGSR